MERDEMPCDVVFVGAGPANLCGAIHLMNLIERHNAAIEAGEKQGEAIEEPTIVVLEKGSEVGQHQLSGAVMDPKALDELLPDWRERDDAPVERWVEREELAILTPEGSTEAPWVPPELDNVGKPIVSLGKTCKWLASIAEEKGVNIFPGFTGYDLLWDGDVVAGVRTGDRGIGKDGEPKDEFEPGMDLQSPITVLGEGPRGHLTRKLIQRRKLDADSQPMIYYIGVKEILEMPPGTVEDGWVLHTLGYPLDVKTFGGTFAYAMEGDKVCVGLLAGLNAADPQMDAHHLLQLYKMHPYIREKLGEGKVVKYGAKAVTIGGWGSLPKLYTDGAMIAGDSAGMFNPLRIKGIHLSMKSGMLAAEAAFEAMVKGDASAEALSVYATKVRSSWIRDDMEPGQNMHHNFHNHFVSGMLQTAVQYAFGAGPLKEFDEDYVHMKKVSEYEPAPWMRQEIPYDGTYLIDKLTDVYHSGTQHEEQQPAHLKIVDTEVCATTCLEEYGNPCTKFCPAQVYNMRENEQSGRLEMEVDFGNCVHCKTCDIRDPYQIITWMPPEGGDGPEYDIM